MGKEINTAKKAVLSGPDLLLEGGRQGGGALIAPGHCNMEKQWLGEAAWAELLAGSKGQSTAEPAPKDSDLGMWEVCQPSSSLAPNPAPPSTPRVLPSGSDGVESACNAGGPGFDPWDGTIPWRREWPPTRVFLPGESHGQRSPGGYGPQGHKESDTTERLTLSLSG